MAGKATSFGAEADLYDRARPEYPAEAVAWMLPAGARDVADVGAGTGKLTSGLVAEGRVLTAIDPDAQMLARLSERLPGIRTLVGSGEELPLPDESMDAVVFGQAWHWVDPPRASLEVGRVLRPGGMLGLIWNIRDHAEPWVRELTAAMHTSDAEDLISSGGPVVGEPFGPLEVQTFPWVASFTVDSLVELAASRSYIITATPERRNEVLAAVRSLGERVRDAGGRIALPYVTHAYRATRPSGT
ncbi:MAG: class I SAM-dependent methyltransferase [Pseudolysinimonas sp.]